MQNQAFTFIIFILNGFIIGILFDIFRILRKSFKTPDLITYIEDIIFWILSGLIILYSIFKFNSGELRLFIFVGVLLGIWFYTLMLSKFFIKMSVHIIQFIKKIIEIFIFKPIKFMTKILNTIIFKPIKFLIKKFMRFSKRIMYFFRKKTKKPFFKNRIYKNKKDFA